MSVPYFLPTDHSSHEKLMSKDLQFQLCLFYTSLIALHLSPKMHLQLTSLLPVASYFSSYFFKGPVRVIY